MCVCLHHNNKEEEEDRDRKRREGRVKEIERERIWKERAKKEYFFIVWTLIETANTRLIRN